MFEGSVYEQGHIEVGPGDAFVMYSDGITEAESPDGTPFDEAGLERTLALHVGAYGTRGSSRAGSALSSTRSSAIAATSGSPTI